MSILGTSINTCLTDLETGFGRQHDLLENINRINYLFLFTSGVSDPAFKMRFLCAWKTSIKNVYFVEISQKLNRKKLLKQGENKYLSMNDTI